VNTASIDQTLREIAAEDAQSPEELGPTLVFSRRVITIRKIFYLANLGATQSKAALIIFSKTSICCIPRT